MINQNVFLVVTRYIREGLWNPELQADETELQTKGNPLKSVLKFKENLHFLYENRCRYRVESWLIDIEQLKIEKELYCVERAVWLSERPIVFFIANFLPSLNDYNLTSICVSPFWAMDRKIIEATYLLMAVYFFT